MPEPGASAVRRRADCRAKRRVLFIGEGSTLAHAARPLALAEALPKDRFDVTVAVPERYRQWVPAPARWLPLVAQTPEAFAERLRSGRPLFSRPRLDQYVAEDLALIGAALPEVVIGDFRLSLAASARKAGVPYITISNAYWSPDKVLRVARPTLDRFRGWPSAPAELAFRALAPTAMRWHARQIDGLLVSHGLEGVGGDIRRAFTEADLTLYADLPSLFPDVPETEMRRFLGPVSWEPPMDLPAWWEEVPDHKPMIYLTLGSSGDVSTLGRMTGWLAELGFTVMLATAGRAQIEGDGESLFVASYLPGLAACARADLVICNGGSPTTTQALLMGRPVLGVASNMDQLLNMRAVQARGAGLTLRADTLSRGPFERAVDQLSLLRAARAASTLAEEAENQNPAEVLAAAIEGLAGA